MHLQKNFDGSMIQKDHHYSIYIYIYRHIILLLLYRHIILIHVHNTELCHLSICLDIKRYLRIKSMIENARNKF